MNLDPEVCFRASRALDHRFDGRFFVAITSTRIYCRPICPARPAKRTNMRFFAHAAAAERAGFGPCLRCRPERAPGLAPVDSISRLVNAAIAGIEEHACSSARVSELASSLGVSDRHLRRVTESELGVSPIELVQTQRLLLAKRLLRETSMNLTDIAFASGFGSVRRFNALFKSRYGLSPSEVRGSASQPDGLRVQLEFRPPYAWDTMLTYLRLRSIPGVEMVDGTHYRRTVAFGNSSGWIEVSMAASGTALDLEVASTLSAHIGAIIARVKQLFDLSAAPDTISEHLGKDLLLKRTVKRLPGLRVAGAFDGFELAVRTVLGQQVSVIGASTISGRLAAAIGAPIATPFAALNRVSVRPETLADAHEDQVAMLGMVGTRARCLIRTCQSRGGTPRDALSGHERQ